MIAGISYDIVGAKGKEQLRNVRIGGKPLSSWKSYKIAVPEGIGMGMRDISSVFKLVFRKTTNTRVPIITAIEQQLKRQGGVVKAYPTRTSASAKR